MTPCLDSDSWLSSRVPAVVSQINTGTLSKLQYPMQGTANCVWNRQDAKTGNIVSFPKIQDDDSFIRVVSMSDYSVSEEFTKKFLKKSVPELEPEPIHSCSSDLDDIMNRDAMTLDQDVLSFLARFA
jgi:hypothetical protein